jgi:aspartate aminotransferase
MTISAKVRQAVQQQSWIRQMFELGLQLKRQHGERNVYDLSLGNPVLEPPQAFRQELLRLAQSDARGLHRYMPNAGYPETRAAVASQLNRETGLPFAASDVVMTCGAGGALNVILKALLDPGDEVVVFSPYFPEYPFYVDNHSGATRLASTDETFLPDLDALEKVLSLKTKVVLVNSPNNPTGVVYPAERLRALGQALARHEARHGRTVYLVSDEPYSRLIYDGLVYPHIYRFHSATIVANSYSKDLSLPGERIGYVAVNPGCPDKAALVDALVFCNRVLGFVNAPAMAQHLARALQGVTVDVAWYQHRRDLVFQELTGMGYTMMKPQGAFYAFPRSPLPDDVAFVKELMRWNVLVTPGSGFGAPGFFRIAYCVDDWVLEGALVGFRKTARQFGLRG